MKILAIDTSAEIGSVVALDSAGAGRVTEGVLDSPGGHSTRLFGEIRAVLARAGVTLDEIDCFAAGAGPGSFTGVRVALSAAKGLAMALGKPMAAVSNLRALAWLGQAQVRVAAIDARRGDLFLAAYDARGAVLRAEALTASPAEWLAPLGAGFEIVTAQPAILPTEWRDAVRVVGQESVGRAVAELALDPSIQVDPAATDANYVRRADAELRWVDRA